MPRQNPDKDKSRAQNKASRASSLPSTPVYMGIDMGTKSMWWSCVRPCPQSPENPRGWELVATGPFPQTVQSLQAQECLVYSTSFEEALGALLRQYKPACVGMERFQVRGPRTGILAELVSYMLGLSFAACARAHSEMWPLTAVEWKSKLRHPPKSKSRTKAKDNTNTPPSSAATRLEELYLLAKASRVPPHLIDSLCIALYTMAKDQGRAPFTRPAFTQPQTTKAQTQAQGQEWAGAVQPQDVLAQVLACWKPPLPKSKTKAKAAPQKKAKLSPKAKA